MSKRSSANVSGISQTHVFQPESSRSLNADVKRKSVKFRSSIKLMEAVTRNDFNEVQELLKCNVDPNKAGDDGVTALHQACMENFHEIVNLLLDYNASINAIDSEYCTPLHSACARGHTTIARILVDNGADLLAANIDQNLPSEICENAEMTLFMKQEMAKKGITREAIVHAKNARENKIIHDAVKFVANGNDINVQDNTGATLLHIAAANGYVELANFFFRHSRMVNVQDRDGWTPLHAAACWGQLEMCMILGSQNNADPTIENNHGETPLDLTADDEVKGFLQDLVKSFKEGKKLRTAMEVQKRNDILWETNVSTEKNQFSKDKNLVNKGKEYKVIEPKSEYEFWRKKQQKSNKDQYSKESYHVVPHLFPGLSRTGVPVYSDIPTSNKSTLSSQSKLHHQPSADYDIVVRSSNNPNFQIGKKRPAKKNPKHKNKRYLLNDSSKFFSKKHKYVSAVPSSKQEFCNIM